MAVNKKKYIILLFFLLSFNITLAHNEIEKIEKHFYFKIGYLDFHNSTVKKFGYIQNVKVGFLLKNKHNLILDYKQGDIQTKINRTLHVKKYSLGYQYLFNRNRFILNLLYVDDSLVEDADNLKVYGIGFGHQNLEIRQYFEDFKYFNVYETDFKYFIPFKNFKAMFIGKYISMDKKKSISKNADKSYLTVGFITHGNVNEIHIGVGGFIGKRVFTVMGNGTNLQHHPFEFIYTYIFKIGKKLKYGTFHIGLTSSKAKELPANHSNVKINSISIDYSLKF